MASNSTSATVAFSLLLPLLPLSIFRPSLLLFPASIFFLSSVISLAQFQVQGAALGIIGWTILKAFTVWVLWKSVKKKVKPVVIPTILVLVTTGTALRLANVWRESSTAAWAISAGVVGLVQELGVTAAVVAGKRKWRREKLFLLSELFAVAFEFLSIILRPSSSTSPPSSSEWQFFYIPLAWSGSTIVLSTLVLLRYTSLEIGSHTQSTFTLPLLPTSNVSSTHRLPVARPLKDGEKHALSTSSSQSIIIQVSSPDSLNGEFDDQSPVEESRYLQVPGLFAVSGTGTGAGSGLGDEVYADRDLKRAQAERRLVGSPSLRSFGREGTPSSIYSEDGSGSRRAEEEEDALELSHVSSWGNLGVIQEMTEELMDSEQKTGMGGLGMNIVFRGSNVEESVHTDTSSGSVYQEELTDTEVERIRSSSTCRPASSLSSSTERDERQTAGEMELEEELIDDMVRSSSQQAWEAIASDFAGELSRSTTSYTLSPGWSKLQFSTPNAKDYAHSLTQTTPARSPRSPDGLLAPFSLEDDLEETSPSPCQKPYKRPGLSNSWSPSASAVVATSSEVETSPRRWSDSYLIQRAGAGAGAGERVKPVPYSLAPLPLLDSAFTRSPPPPKHTSLEESLKFPIRSFSPTVLQAIEESWDPPLTPPSPSLDVLLATAELDSLASTGKVPPLNLNISPRRGATHSQVPAAPTSTETATTATLIASPPTSPVSGLPYRKPRSFIPILSRDRDRKWQWWRSGVASSATPPLTASSRDRQPSPNGGGSSGGESSSSPSVSVGLASPRIPLPYSRCSSRLDTKGSSTSTSSSTPTRSGPQDSRLREEGEGIFETAQAAFLSSVMNFKPKLDSPDFPNLMDETPPFLERSDTHEKGDDFAQLQLRSYWSADSDSLGGGDADTTSVSVSVRSGGGWSAKLSSLQGGSSEKRKKAKLSPTTPSTCGAKSVSSESS